MSSTQAVDDMAHELSDDENLANTSIQDTKTEEIKIEQEEESLSIDDELDVEIGVAELQPLLRATVQRVVVERNNAPTYSYPRAVSSAESPPPIPERSLRRAKALLPLVASQALVALHAPQRKGEEERERETRREGVVVRTPPPLPLRPQEMKIKRTVISVPAVLSQKTNVVLKPPPRAPIAPFTQQCMMEQLIASVCAAYSSSVYSNDQEDVDEEVENMWVDMRAMYAKYAAGQLVFPPSPAELPMPEELVEEEEEFEREVFESQRKFFEVLDYEKREFRSPFQEDFSGKEVDDLLDLFPQPPTKTRKVSEESVERALRDESVLGGDEMTEDVEAKSALISLPEGRKQQFEFIAADAWLLAKQEIANPNGEFAILRQAWSVFEEERSFGFPSSSAPSLLPSTFLGNRSTEAMLYLPVENPFHSDENPDSIEEFKEDSENQVGLAGLNVEALVADIQGTEFSLQDTAKGKGDPEILTLTPHSPRRKCGCFHCEEHSRPVRPSDVAHDPNQWCYCLDCRVFREEAAKAEFWKTHFAKLDAQAQEAKDEKKRKADLLNFKAEDTSEPSKPKKACGLGRWVRRHLACSSSDE